MQVFMQGSEYILPEHGKVPNLSMHYMINKMYLLRLLSIMSILKNASL